MDQKSTFADLGVLLRLASDAVEKLFSQHNADAAFSDFDHCIKEVRQIADALSRMGSAIPKDVVRS